jgi:hypothetical protein
VGDDVLRRKTVTVLLALVGTLLAGVLTAGSAAAAQEVPVMQATSVPANGRVSCYGYYGTFRTDTLVIVVDWITSSNECFGIATDNTIWHTWPNSGGWRPMPGNGHADSIAYTQFREDPVTKFRKIAVYAAVNDSYWCQNYYPSTDWGGWYRCG